jgi:hypothetical protein
MTMNRNKMVSMPDTEQETRASIAKFSLAKVHGEPTNQDIDLLDNKLNSLVSSFPTSLRGLYRHAGLLKSVFNYDQLAPGTPFIAHPSAQCGQ